MPEWLRFLLQTFLGIATAILAAYLSARWAAERFIKERWWQRKETAYLEIIESLSDLISYASYCSDLYLRSTTGSPPKELSERRREAHWKIEKAADVGALVISEKAAQALKELQTRPQLDPDKNPLFELFDDDWKHYKKALEIVRECAREELIKEKK